MRLDIHQMVEGSDKEYIMRNRDLASQRINFITGESSLTLLAAPADVTRKVSNAKRWTLQGETRLYAQSGILLQVGQKGDYLVEESDSLKIYRKDEYADYFN